MAAKFHLGIDLNGQRGVNAADPTGATDLATKQYADNLLRGINDMKDPVRAASTANVAIATGLVNGAAIDGVTLATGDRVLLKNQTAAAENGIYVVVASGAASRATDADASAEVTRGMATTVLEGTNKGTGAAQANPLTYILSTADPITLGTTALTFVPIGGTGGGTSKAAGAGLTEDATNYNVGAGTGIAVTADAVAIDTAVVVRKVAADNAAATTTVVTHNWGTRDVQVEVFHKTTFLTEYPDVTRTDLNTVTITFASAPAAGTYRILVQG